MGADGYEDTGNGLAVIKKLVERLGGSVRMKSTSGEGSIFLLHFPGLELIRRVRERNSGTVQGTSRWPH